MVDTGGGLFDLGRDRRGDLRTVDAKPAGRQLEVSWDASAPRAVNATRALLGVSDGDAHHDIELTPAQIRAGKYTYTPAHGDVALRMILYEKGLGVAGDAVRVAAIPNLVEIPAEVKPATGADRAAATPAPSSPSSPSASPRPRFVVPPSTIREVQPNIPAGIRSRIQDRVVMPVEVEINAQGRVTRATADVSGDGVRRYLAEQAQKAAQQWRFTAARAKGGARVASSKTLYFVFTQ